MDVAISIRHTDPKIGILFDKPRIGQSSLQFKVSQEIKTKRNLILCQRLGQRYFGPLTDSVHTDITILQLLAENNKAFPLCHLQHVQTPIKIMFVVSPLPIHHPLCGHIYKHRQENHPLVLILSFQGIQGHGSKQMTRRSNAKVTPSGVFMLKPFRPP